MTEQSNHQSIVSQSTINQPESTYLHTPAKKVKNNLQALFPEIAKEAHGWDPKLISIGSHQKLEWKCKHGHIFIAQPGQRTRKRPTGCPYCSNRIVLVGYNDLKTTHPEIAKEAHGWDPTKYPSGSTKMMKWKCPIGHIYELKICTKTTGGRGGKPVGCGICSGMRVLVGYNDLKTTHPEIAKEAHGWDPTTVSPGAKTRKQWKCDRGHIYETMVWHRTKGTQCPFCAGKRILIGYNDLKTTHPEIAKEAYGWDPTTTSKGRNDKYQWKCDKGHIYEATPNSRTGDISNNPSGCPICAEYGFNPSKKAWMYLMKRPGEYQIGITNDIKTRIKRHMSDGWILLDQKGPSGGVEVLELETRLKQWIRQNIGLIEGKRENWKSSNLEIETLHQLKIISGIDTQII